MCNVSACTKSRSRPGEHVDLATSLSKRHDPVGGFTSFFFYSNMTCDWKELNVRFSFSFHVLYRVHLNPVSLSSLPSTSRATGSKKNFHSSRLNITSEFVIVPPFFLYWKLIPYYYFIASSWNVRNWHRRRLKSNDTMSW